MIDTQPLVDEFCELARVESPSGQEAAIADLVVAKLQALGLTVQRDRAGEPIEGQCGNIIATLPATDPGLPTIMLNAHLDTVQPCCGVQPTCQGDDICSAGDTILGADDRAGIALILAALRELVARPFPHGELQVVFTIAEEIGLFGARYLDYSLVNPRYALVFDGGRQAGEMVVAAPSAAKLTWKVRGVAAHAGVHPEQGTSAIQIAAQAIAGMKLGRLDEETTANIGYVHGGLARNIVPESCEVWGEARSHDERKLAAQVSHMRQCFEQAVAAYPAATLEEEVQSSYKHFHLGENEEVVRLGARAAECLGLPVSYHIGGGGSDANTFNEHGITAVICACGTQNPHCLNERLHVPTLVSGVSWLLEMIRISGEIADEEPPVLCPC
jgi:tripeptide aminopeptidase